MIHKTLNNFMNEEISSERIKNLRPNSNPKEFDDVLKQITNSLRFDFKLNPLEVKTFIDDNIDTIKKCFDKGYNYKRIIAFTKLKPEEEND